MYIETWKKHSVAKTNKVRAKPINNASQLVTKILRQKEKEKKKF